MASADETRPACSTAALVLPPVFLVLVWAVYVGIVEVFFHPFPPGDDGADTILMFPFLALAFLTLGVGAVWFVALTAEGVRPRSPQ